MPSFYVKAKDEEGNNRELEIIILPDGMVKVRVVR